MIKISTIILFLSISFCLAKVPLRDPEHWDNWNNIDLLNKYMGGFKFGGSNQLVKDDYFRVKGIKMIGSYKIGFNYFIYLQKKPNFVHRFFTKLLLGWVWKDAK